MKELFEKNKMVVIGVLVILVVAIVAFMLLGNRNEPVVEEELTAEEMEEAPIPTVDPSVKVDVKAVNNDREVEITVSNAPKGTESIDIELSYETADKGLQGAIGAIMVKDGGGTKKITLGTCSSGTCVYHNVTSDIKVYLKFNGDYGEQIFEKNFTI